MVQDLISPQQLHQFDNLELLAQQVVEGFIIGLHKSPFHGFSVEFAEHRLYNPGNSIKNIDWKVYTRTDKLFVKRFEEETNLRCRIIVDVSSTMYYPLEAGKEGYPNLNKLQFSTISAAAIMYICKKQRDAIGLSLIDDAVSFHTKAKSTTVHHNLLSSTLQKYLNSQERKSKHATDVAKCLHEIAENIHKRSLVIIFSDCDVFSRPAHQIDEFFASLQHLRYNKHEVVYFHVTDKNTEIDFNFENRPYIFVDMENGEEIKLQPNQVKQHYQQQLDNYMNELKLRCTQHRIDFIDADINQPFSQILLPYLAKRNKMMGGS